MPAKGDSVGLRNRLSYLALLAAKAFSKTLYRLEVTWIGDPPRDPWRCIQVAAILNHTSLFEWLFAAAPPNAFLRRLATKAVLPSADKTMERPVVGHFYSLMAGEVVSITRERDQTWDQVLERIGSDSMVLIAPEGRMKRLDGLDMDHRPMTVRGGIADILRIKSEGRMLLAYSGGLHQVQAPGERLPRLFKTIRLALEVVDISTYVESLGGEPGSDAFKKAIKADLERRRDLHSPPEIERRRWSKPGDRARRG